jgi:hypothetical protein
VDQSSWNEDISIGRLFGHLCSGSDFAHDNFMRQNLDQTDDEGDQRSKKRARFEADISTESSQSSDLVEVHADTGNTAHKAHSALDGIIEQSSHTSCTTATATSQVPPDNDLELSKRAEIQKAHLYLQEHADPSVLEIGPLPSSWPEVSTTKTPTPNLFPNPREPSFASMGDSASSPRRPEPSNSQVEDSQHTDLLSLSISESDLNASPQSEYKQGREGTTDRNARRQARVAAYLAAREDSWAEISLVSAGDNHAEEELEL